jgi:hypothetical protein
MKKSMSLQVEVKSNIKEFCELLAKVDEQAKQLKETVEQINNFQLEINTELIKAEKKEAAPEVSIQAQPAKETTLKNAIRVLDEAITQIPFSSERVIALTTVIKTLSEISPLTRF